MRECGDCKMCCKLFDVKLQVSIDTAEHVPEGQVSPGQYGSLSMIDYIKKGTDWCPACLPGAGNKGCLIYDNRPKVCRDFYCLWVQRDVIPEQFKPSKIKCVLTTAKNSDGSQMLQVNVDPDRPDAWRRLDFYAWLISLDIDVIVIEGKKRTEFKKLRKAS